MRFMLLTGLLLLVTPFARAQQSAPLAKALLFHASFDSSVDADFAAGDGRMYTAASLKRADVRAGLHSDAVAVERTDGRYGGSLLFSKKSNPLVFFKGAGNVPATNDEFQGTFSFWLRLSPDEDLPPGYVDPLQITDKKWNDASFFVDFTKETPRKFRLGVFSNYKFWNPQDRKWDDIPDQERPLVTVGKAPFSRQRWTHVGITFGDFHATDRTGVATLYLNGESQGAIRRKQRLTWGDERLAVMLGIGYVGRLDDLAVFDRPLTAAEIKTLFGLPGGIKALGKTAQASQR